MNGLGPRGKRPSKKQTQHMGEGGNHIMEDPVAICIVNLPASRALHRAKVQQL